MNVRFNLPGCCAIILALCCAGRLASQTQTGQPPPAGPVATNKVTLKAGSELKLRFAQTVDSKTAVVGDLVELVLHEDVKADGQLVARKGLRALARVTEGRPAEKKRESAKKLVIELDSLLLGGKPVPIAGGLREKAKTDAGDVVAGGLVFGLAGVLGVLSARHVTIKEGTVISVYVESDVEVEALPSPGGENDD
ncbi:MAG: hypothetical protein LAO78_23640 [Acidobacteriia bacterium]|nr:hypothetical protein [Terriglobia bacterium]